MDLVISPRRKAASHPSAPSPLVLWYWWEILLLLWASVYCALFGFPFLACRLIAFDCFNCTHSYKTLAELQLSKSHVMLRTEACLRRLGV